MTVTNPLKWLLQELPSYIAPDQLAELLIRYESNKARYARQSAINVATRSVANYARRGRPDEAKALARWQAKLARWQAKLARLKAEQENE